MTFAEAPIRESAVAIIAVHADRTHAGRAGD
jgi:hypothetical protein